MTPRIPRNILAQHFGGDSRMIAAFEEINATVQDNEAKTVENVAATSALNDATVIVLSANEAFDNERILKLDDGLEAIVDDTYVTIKLKDVARSSGYAVTLFAAGDSELVVPLAGTVVTFEHAGANLGNYATDAAAAAGGVIVGGLYHNAGAVRVRLT